MFAFIDNLGGTELLLVMVAALLVFGKRLPQVAGDAARQLAKLRRSFDEAWRETGMEKELQSMKRDLDAAIPRDLSIGDMARAASAEMDRRIRANEEGARREARVEPRVEPGASAEAAPKLILPPAMSPPTNPAPANPAPADPAPADPGTVGGPTAKNVDLL